MSAKTKVNSFIRQFVALVEGDKSEVIAEKVLRKAEAALETRLAALKGHIVDAEQNVEDAKEGLITARLNSGRMIDSRDAYVDTIINANSLVTESEQKLENIKNTIEVLEGELAKIRE
jgi:hypothetical protein